MIRRPPRSILTDTPFPYTAPFRSLTAADLQDPLARSPFISFLAPEVTEADPDRGRVAMRVAMRPEFERLADSNQFHGGVIAALIDTVRSEERRVGKECVSTCRYRCSKCT